MFEYPTAITGETFPAFTATTKPEPTPSEERGATSVPVHGSATGTALVLALPKTGNYGVSRLSVLVGDKASPSLNEGQPTPEVLDAEPFCLAPGLDVMELGWHLPNAAEVKKLTLELFCAGKQEAIATKVLEVTEGKNPLTAGPDKFHDVTGTAVWTKDFFTFSDAAAFPDGLPTAKHSPYQLRATVEKNDASQLPGYPLIAWTYFHVKVASIELAWGEEAHIPTATPNGCDPAHEGTWADREKKVLADLTREHRTPVDEEDGELPIVLDVNLLGDKDDDFAAHYKEVWGAGPRLPILAKVKVKRASGAAEEDPKALAGLELFWDWEAPLAEGWPRWLGRDPESDSDDWKKDSSTGDRAFLSKLLDDPDSEPDLGPPLCANCPAVYGGVRRLKAADPAVHVFPAQTGADAFPFAVAHLPSPTKRPWAATSKFGQGDQGAQSGVLFAPGRIAGDVFKVTCYLALADAAGKLVLDVAEKDLGEPLAPLREHMERSEKGQLPHASTGLMRVYRRQIVHYYPFPTTLPRQWIDETAAQYRQLAGVILDAQVANATPGLFRDAARYKTAFLEMLGYKGTYRWQVDGRDDTKHIQFALRNAFLDPDTEVNPNDPRDFVQVRDHGAYEARCQQSFKNNKVFAVDLSAAPPAGNPEMKAGTAEGWIIGKAPWGEKTFLLMSKNGQPFTQGAQLKWEGYKETDGRVERDPGQDKTVTIDAVRSKASGWLATQVTLKGGGAKASEVKLKVGTSSVTLTFAKKLLQKHPTTELDKGLRSSIEQTVIAGVNAHPTGGAALRVEVEGVATTPRDQKRLVAVRTAVMTLFEDGTVLDNHDLYTTWAVSEESFLRRTEYPERLDTQAAYLWGRLQKKWQKDDLTGRLGVHYLSYEQLSRATSWPSGASFTSDNTRTLGVAYSLCPGRKQTPRQAYVQPIPLVVHEVGHAIYLGHAGTRIFAVKPPTSDAGELKAHLPYSSTCVMNYDPDPLSERFCALCMVKLRGWDLTKIDRHVHLVPDTSNVDVDVAIDKAIEHLEEDLAIVDHKAWVRMAMAVALSQKKALADARVIDGRKKEDATYAYQRWPKRARLNELKDKKKKSKAEVKEYDQLSKEYEAEKKRCDDEGTRIIREKSEERKAAVGVAEQLELAAEEYKKGDAQLRQALGITMLRALAWGHLQYGDVEKGEHYYKLLSDRTSHPEDHGPKRWESDGEGGLKLKFMPESLAYWAEALKTTRSHEYRITLSVGDLDDVFPAGGGGKLAKLQAMGLIARPLKHASIGDAARFGEEYAARLGLDTDPKIDAALREFLVEGGALPLKGGAGKVRVHGGYAVNNSQTAMMLMFPEDEYPASEGFQKGEHALEQPYSRFMLGAERAAVEDAFHQDNPALGKLPLKLQVERRVKGDSDAAWKPAEKGVRIYVSLVAPPPDELPDYQDVAPDAAQYDLAGGKSYYNQPVAPPLKAAPAQYVKAKAGDFEPGDPGDPQAGNTHFMLGGKRGLRPDGNVSEPLLQALENVFCGTRQEGFKGLPPAGSGERRDHTVCLETDAQGLARLCFSPSRIGGDRYKLRVYVGPPTHPGTGADACVVETGTMVRWRTVRVCRHLRMEPSQNAGELPDYLTANGQPPNVDRHLGALPDVDLKGYVTKELARAYCELILDPGAQQPTSISAHGGEIVEYAKGMLQKYKTLNRPSLSKVMSVFKAQLVPTPGDETGTKWQAQLPTVRPEPGSVSIRPAGGGKDSALAADADKSGTMGALKGGVTSARVDYHSGKVEVEFDASQAGKRFDIAYYPLDYLDLDALIIWPAKSPFLFNLRLPADYNARIGPGTVPLPTEGKPEHAHMYVDDQKSGLCKGWLSQALVRGVDDNDGYYPGLLIFQARALDDYTVIWPSGTQEGKGVENGILLFGGTAGAQWNGLCVHEISHGLYLRHAPTANGNAPHLHDSADTCVMSYDQNDGDHCGHCVASLRGMTVEQEPFIAPE